MISLVLAVQVTITQILGVCLFMVRYVPKGLPGTGQISANTLVRIRLLV